jgi:hypothetical protein
MDAEEWACSAFSTAKEYDEVNTVDKESARGYAAKVFRQAKEALEGSANGWQTFLDRVRCMVSISLEKMGGDRPCAARLALGREVLHELPELHDATVSAEVRQKRFTIAARAMCHNIGLVAEVAWEDPGVGKEEEKSRLLNPASVDAGPQQDPASRICRRSVYVPDTGRVLWVYSSSSPMKPLGVTFLNAISLAGTFHDEGLDCMEPGQEQWLTRVRLSVPTQKSASCHVQPPYVWKLLCRCAGMFHWSRAKHSRVFAHRPSLSRRPACPIRGEARATTGAGSCCPL